MIPEDRKELMVTGLQENIRDIVQIIREETQMVPLERIILGGINQGCATAILTLLSSGMDLGGFVGWCSWLPCQESIGKLPIGCINLDIFGPYCKFPQIQTLHHLNKSSSRFPENSNRDRETKRPGQRK
jgi:hypothetical protein